MKIKSVQLKRFKRFTDLTIRSIPDSARLVVLVGPNGSGKTSVFEAFNAWHRAHTRGIPIDVDYHLKGKAEENRASIVGNYEFVEQSVRLSFYEGKLKPGRGDRESAKKWFYIRSAHRNQPDFKTSSLSRQGSALDNPGTPDVLINSETRVESNYQRLVGKSLDSLYHPANRAETAGDIVDRHIGLLRDAMRRVFEDLNLVGPGNPIGTGTFFFGKGVSANFQYKNLSGGEKAAFDLLLDFVAKGQAYDDTVYCIDEPELHLHTKLQARLLDELYLQLPEGCQLWISTHSIGMTRKAMELHRQDPEAVVFLDFGNHDFDVPVVMEPIVVDRSFWKEVFAVPLDDLVELVAPAEIVFCEGSREQGSSERNPSFDASIYRTIFGSSHPETEFVPLGGTTEVEKNAILVSGVLDRIFSGIKMWSLFDQDDRSPQEVMDLRERGIRVLNRRDIESYLWDDEVLNALCDNIEAPEHAASLKQAKADLMAEASANGIPSDDVKYISGRLYNKAKVVMQNLGVNQFGNNARSFMRDTLAPLIKPGMDVYSQLESDVFEDA